MALGAAEQIEDRTRDGVAFAMEEAGLTWVEVSADGLQISLTGTAPDEAARFRAISLAGSLVDGDRIVDRLDVVEAARYTPPPFSLEMLRNDDGVSLIGLIPEEGAEDLMGDLPDMGRGTEVVDLVETAAFPAPEGWEAAVDYGMRALGALPRAKVSVTEGRVEVEAVSRSPEERADFLATLERRQPRGVEIVLDISAPRPVITPFTLRFVRQDGAARFEACSADSEAAARRILEAAREAGLGEDGTCEIGLGVPSPNWTAAVETALAAAARLETASLTFSDADVTLIAAETTDQALFDRVVGELDAALPEVFTLHGVLPEPEDASAPAGPPRFIATLSEEGAVELRGRLPDARIEAAVGAYARAQFDGGEVLIATRRVEDLPEGWSVRVLAGLAALGHLEHGAVRVEPDLVSVEGATGSPSAVSDISRLLGSELGESANFDIEVEYVEALDPASQIPTPEECAARIGAILEETKITFDPGSVEINAATAGVLDRIAEVLPDCRHAAMEIGGHTDSQGRESMNLRLSQSRADAVLNGLLARDVLVGNLTARGYGESRPIADNETEAGRETNRRIEFRLLDEIAAEEARIAEAEREAALAALPEPTPRPEREDDG